jgi:hypothetical protein
MESFAVVRSVSFRSIYNGSPFLTFPYTGRDVSRHVLNVSAPEAAVLAVRPLRDIVALMSGILNSMQKVYSSKVFGISAQGCPPSSIRYSLFTFLLEFRTCLCIGKEPNILS